MTSRFIMPLNGAPSNVAIDLNALGTVWGVV